MKKLLGIVVLSLILFVNQTNKSFAIEFGHGKLKLSDVVLESFIKFIKGKGKNSPYIFSVADDGKQYQYWICSAGQGNCRGGNHNLVNKDCLKYSKKYGSGVKCSVFAHGRTVRWDNGINKKTKFNSKWTDAEFKAKLTEIGFYGTTTTTKKVEKKKEEKVVKKYSTEGERSLALSWQGYSDLIAGTIKFDEADYKGTLKLSLPNNDGTCDGSYSLLSNGKGTWQISCTNNMAASGTLKRIEDGGVTGKGKDLNGKNVKFTVSKES